MSVEGYPQLWPTANHSVGLHTILGRLANQDKSIRKHRAGDSRTCPCWTSGPSPFFWSRIQSTYPGHHRYFSRNERAKILVRVSDVWHHRLCAIRPACGQDSCRVRRRSIDSPFRKMTIQSRPGCALRRITKRSSDTASSMELHRA